MKRLILILALALVAGVLTLPAQKGSTAKKPTTTAKSPQKKPGTTGKGTTATKGGTQKEKEPAVTSKAGKLEENRIDTFRVQVTPLVMFFESTLNFLCDPRNQVSEKQVILTRSYLKWCWDSEVQIEDDLDENRLVPLYKDAPAYLTDVSFFFRSAKFLYTVQDVSVENNPLGFTYFRVTANRSLKGITVNGDSVNSNKVRYVEINYDSVKQILKIVSVYTTKLNEKEDLRNWWNALSPEWKSALGGDKKLEGTMPMATIDSFNDSLAMIGGRPTAIMGSEFYRYLGEIVNATSLDLSGSKTIATLDPLTKLSSLQEVNLAGCAVSDLTPLRNLNKLEKLDISNTLISSLDPLQFCLNINRLRMKGSKVSDLSVLPAFKNLSVLDISATPVRSLAPLAELTAMKDLRLAGTAVSDLQPLKSLTGIEILSLSGSGVTDLAPLSEMQNLHILLADSTAISSLSPLYNLTGLQRIYCNSSKVSRKEALAFLKKQPGVSLVYASRELQAWWQTMTPEWQTVFSFYGTLNNPPTVEQLHRLALIDSVNIAGRVSITSLDPLSMLILLRHLQCQTTGVASLAPLKELSELSYLNASSTKVADLVPLADLQALGTLILDNTGVSSLAPLEGLKNLTHVYCDNTQVETKEADRFALKNPECLVVYQTFENTGWWKGLPKSWQDVLAQQADVKGEPDRNALQQMAGLIAVTITDNPSINDLGPLQHLSRLAVLDFSGTAVASLAPVNRMPSLKTLRCQRNPITDLMPLAGLPNLTELDFSNTQVADLDALQNMMKLEVLKFSGTQVKNLKYLEKLVNLRVLEFYNTRVTTIDVLDGMSKLESVKMFNTKVSSKRVDKLRVTHPKCEIVYY